MLHPKQQQQQRSVGETIYDAAILYHLLEARYMYYVQKHYFMNTNNANNNRNPKNDFWEAAAWRKRHVRCRCLCVVAKRYDEQKQKQNITYKLQKAYNLTIYTTSDT